MAGLPAWLACLTETDRLHHPAVLTAYATGAALVLTAAGYAGYQVWATMDGLDAAVRTMLVH